MPEPRLVVLDVYGTVLNVHTAAARHALRVGPYAAALSDVSANAWDAYGTGRFGFRPVWFNRAGPRVAYWLDETATILPGLGALLA